MPAAATRGQEAKWSQDGEKSDKQSTCDNKGTSEAHFTFKKENRHTFIHLLWNAPSFHIYKAKSKQKSVPVDIQVVAHTHKSFTIITELLYQPPREITCMKIQGRCLFLSSFGPQPAALLKRTPVLWELSTTLGLVTRYVLLTPSLQLGRRCFSPRFHFKTWSHRMPVTTRKQDMT